MDPHSIQEAIDHAVDSGIIPTLMDYIRVPSLSTAYDPSWETNGYMEQAQQILLQYVDSLQIQGLTYDILKEPGKPWLVYGEVQATAQGKGTILMYGHMDKQPHLSGWTIAGPTDPQILDGKLYGRGGGDDGYALPGAALIIKTLQTLGIPHGRIVIVAENEEESGSDNLIYYINSLKARIGEPELVICLDSGILNYEQFFITSSLRGNLTIDVTVKTLTSGVHSGIGSGSVPSPYRIMQQLISRVEDQNTGDILLPELHTQLQPHQYEASAKIAKLIGPVMRHAFPFELGVRMMSDDPVQLLFNGAWKPTLTVVGEEGLPLASIAGNVIQPFYKARLSFRIPPGVDQHVANDAIIRAITHDPPYRAIIEVDSHAPDAGWAAKQLEPWLNDAIQLASNEFFNKPALEVWLGGSIPFMGMLGEMFPSAQFMITGILHHESNAHGINENFSIAYLKKVLCCIAHVLGTHAARP